MKSPRTSDSVEAPAGLAADLSRRERQIMDALYRLGRASVAQVLDAMPDPPGYSAVRALLRILERKGHVTHVEEAGKYVYLPKRARARAAKHAVRRLLGTFFGGSAAKAVAALLEEADTKLSDDELDAIARTIEQARKEGR